MLMVYDRQCVRFTVRASCTPGMCFNVWTESRSIRALIGMQGGKGELRESRRIFSTWHGFCMAFGISK